MIRNSQTSAPGPGTRSAQRWLLWGSLCISLIGCAPEEIKQYRVAKAADPPAVAMPAAATDEPLTYSVPAGWEKQPNSEMRSASFRTPDGGDMSVVKLPGTAGDLTGNVNRWRGQVGLPPADADTIQKSVSATTLDGAQGIALELYSPVGQPDKAMRVALVEKEGVTWFFKLAGTAKAVKAQAEAFKTFTASVKIKKGESFGTQAALPPMPPADSGAGSNMGGAGMPPIEPQKTDTRLTYKVPTTWTEKEPGSIRIASFAVSQDNLVGDVSIVNLAGDGGGLLSNTNRWRQQLEMAPTDQEGLKNSVKDITVDGNKGYFLALYTGMQGQGMLVALIEQGGQTWFVKMTAPSELAQRQEQTFQTFVKSLQFHNKGAQT